MHSAIRGIQPCTKHSFHFHDSHPSGSGDDTASHHSHGKLQTTEYSSSSRRNRLFFKLSDKEPPVNEMGKDVSTRKERCSRL